MAIQAKLKRQEERKQKPQGPQNQMEISVETRTVKKRNKKDEEEQRVKKQRKEIQKQNRLAIEDKPKTQALPIPRVKPTIKTITKEEHKEPQHKAPSQMNLTHLSEILTHAYENKKLNPDRISEFLKARDEMMANKGNKQIRQKTKLKYQEIYKAEVYKK